MLRIDGSRGEGGGQVLRACIAFSSILGEPVEVYNIRAKRPKPGLARQHLVGLMSFQKIFSARVEGAKLGSTKVRFQPGEMGEEKSYTIEIGTAGSITLLLQALFLPLLHRWTRLNITGGTDVKWSPPVDYFSNVFLPNLKRLGGRAGVELLARGYYPKGGGEVKVSFLGTGPLHGYSFDERGELLGIRGIAHSSNLPKHIVEREARAAKVKLSEEHSYLEPEIRLDVRTHFSTGTGIVLWAEYEHSILGSSSLGERGKPAEKVGREAASALLEEVDSPATLDIHMADQIVPYAALAKGRTSFIARELTGHLKTNMELTEEILGVSFEAEEMESGYRVSVEGKGW